jgi:hypothetical protein
VDAGVKIRLHAALIYQSQLSALPFIHENIAAKIF